MKIQLSDHFTFTKLLRFVFPSIMMMVFTSIYGVVDGFFVSNYAGKTAFAAVNLIMPFIMITSGLGFMFGTGGSALVSMKLGEKDANTANRYFSMITIATCVFGTLLSVFGFIFTPQIANILGASQDMMQDCIIYGRINMIFNVPFMLQNLFQSFFITAEKPKIGLYTTIASGVANMILDFVFIGIFSWGVIGAAIATAIAQCIGAFYPIYYFIRKNDSLLQLHYVKMESKPIIKAATNGASELMSNISSSIVSMLYNLQLMKYYGKDGIAAYGVIMYVQFIFTAIYLGYTIGCAPIISYHYGAQNTKELHNLFKKSYSIMTFLGICLSLFARFSSSFIASLFVGYDPQLMRLTTQAFAFYALCFAPSSINIMTSSFFTALNNGKISAGISFFRTFLFQVGAILLLPFFFGKEGIWLSAFIAEICTLLISLMSLCISNKEYHYLS